MTFRTTITAIFLGLAILSSGLTLNQVATAAHSTTFQVGDVFVSVASGDVQWREPDGTLHATLNTGTSGFTTGMAFDSTGDLYVTTFDSANGVSRFDNDGTLLGTFGSGYSGSTESIVFDGTGNVYVGSVDGDEDIRKFDSAGTSLTQFDVATGPRGSDWIDLNSDQCTMYYTSEGTAIHSFDVCANSQLADFASGLHGAAFALRILPTGGVMVADSSDIHRLNSSGSIVQTYDAPGEDCWFALNLDPDGISFWSADFCTSDVYHFDIASGAVINSFNTGTAAFTVFGLAVFGEITVATEICGDGIDNDGDGAIDEGCNTSPDCSGADSIMLWPPNHKMRTVSITGVTDPDGDPITITIDSIFQDELVDAVGSGDGNTSPDGTGVGSDTAQVRAERQGGGNGRVYHIDFTADDGQGGVCNGEILVTVPHDQSPASAVDDGSLFDSTVP
jgi:hypothetical protein